MCVCVHIYVYLQYVTFVNVCRLHAPRRQDQTEVELGPSLQVLERADVKQSLEDPKFWAHLQSRPQLVTHWHPRSA